jgi:uncharacterized protein (TIGR03067 family)
MPTDLDKLQGTWHVASLESDGRKIPVTALADAVVIVEGNHFTSKGMGMTYEGTLELGQARKLKAFDLLFTAGPQEGRRNLGIYKLVDDRWTICLSTTGGKRPGTFATKPGTGLALETLERNGHSRSATKEKLRSRRATGTLTQARAAEDDFAGSGPPTELEGEWEMVSAVFNGVPMDANMVKWCRRITRGNVTAVIAGPQTMLKAQFRLDDAPRPRAIDYVNLHGAAKGKPQVGIYELTGDTLRICMSPPGKRRPNDFCSTPGDGRSSTTWRLAN